MDGELFDQERKISFAIKAGWKAGKKYLWKMNPTDGK